MVPREVAFETRRPLVRILTLAFFYQAFINNQQYTVNCIEKNEGREWPVNFFGVIVHRKILRKKIFPDNKILT